MPRTLIEPPEQRSVRKPKLNTLLHSNNVQGNQEGQSALLEAFLPDRLRRDNLDWSVVVWMAAMHAGCLVAPFFFSWQALVAAVLLHWLTASIGICLCYHRYFSHKSLRLVKPAEFFALLCGVVSGEGPPLTWAAVHRMHHQLSDKKGDPHSPLDGKWWSHMAWLFTKRSSQQQEMLFRRYAPELAAQPLMRLMERTYGWWLVTTGVLLLTLGGLLIGGWYGAVSMLLWAMCVRMVFAYHSTWLVNSATHLWGYQNYDTRDQSRNLWWVALLAYGEGWHNNHHAHPSLAPAGHRWWEIDMTWWTIKALRFFRLAYDVKDEIPSRTSGS